MHARRCNPHAGEACSLRFLPQRAPRAVSFLDGDLALVNGKHTDGNSYPPSERARWHAMLIHIGDERGYKAGWAAHKYKEKFGAFPAWGASPNPMAPTAEVRSWVRSRQIAYAKRRVA